MMFLCIPPLLFIYSLIFMYFTPVYCSFKPHLIIAGICLLVSILIAGSSLRIFLKNNANISPIAINNTSELIDYGIYKFTRNPMYLSLLIGLIAYFFYLGNPLAIWGIFSYYFITTHFQIKKEETLLLRRFGNQYQAYAHKVRRWI